MTDLYVVAIPDPPDSDYFDGGISEIRGPFSSRDEAEQWWSDHDLHGSIIELGAPDD